MTKNLIFNKFILQNKFLKFHPKEKEIVSIYQKIPYSNMISKMKDNTQFKHNTTNSSANTNLHVEGINNHSTNVLTTLNRLINNLRNSNSALSIPQVSSLMNNQNLEDMDLDFNFEDEFEDEQENDDVDLFGDYDLQEDTTQEDEENTEDEQA